jgi:hypothetical protein
MSQRGSPKKVKAEIDRLRRRFGRRQTVEVTITGPRPARSPSEPRPNLAILTARHWRSKINRTAAAGARGRDEGPDADELRATWGPFVAEAGTYELNAGNLITMRPIVAKNPAVMGPGVFITYSYKREGDTMWVTQQRNQTGPFASPATFKLVRVE